MPKTSRIKNSKASTGTGFFGAGLRFAGKLALLSALILPLLSLLFGTSACNTDNVAYLHYQDMRGWSKQDFVVYELADVDTLPAYKGSKYDMSLNIRIDNNFTYTALPLLVKIESPTGPNRCDTIRIPVEPTDKRKQSIGGLSNLSYTLTRNSPLPKDCRVTLTQVSDKPTLEGVTAVGLLLKRK